MVIFVKCALIIGKSPSKVNTNFLSVGSVHAVLCD